MRIANVYLTSHLPWKCDDVNTSGEFVPIIIKQCRTKKDTSKQTFPPFQGEGCYSKNAST